MRIPIVAGNWKMHGSLAAVRDWVAGLSAALDQGDQNVDWYLFPPAIYLAQAQSLMANTSIEWGAQHISHHDKGAFTGEIALNMITEFGCKAVIIGHSERRQLFGVSNDSVAKTVDLVLANSELVPIICVGESLDERDSGLTLKIIQEQLEVALSLHDNPSALERIVVAYEPVWAIGTGQTATPEQAQDVHAFIRMRLAEISPQLSDSVRIIYGGSVNPANAGDLFAMPDIDGALVGGASLAYDKFLQIGSLCNI
jgi:triosephosphate isomerase (TIM)